jgi:hypothetical protein
VKRRCVGCARKNTFLTSEIRRRPRIRFGDRYIVKGDAAALFDGGQIMYVLFEGLVVLPLDL